MDIRIIAYSAILGLALGSPDHQEVGKSNENHGNDNQVYGNQECSGRYRQENMEVVYSWKILPFNIPLSYLGPLPSSRRQYISGLSVTKDRIFLSTGGVFGRVPVTLATVPKHSCSKAPVLEPYPNFDWHVEAATGANISDCNKAFVTVYRSRLDSCNRIWVLDTGVFYDGDTEVVDQICPPKIVIFDLTTDKPARVITYPESVYRQSSAFNDILLEPPQGGADNSCDAMMVYTLDTANSAVVVYDSAKGLFSRVSNEYIRPYPEWGIHRVGGESFTSMAGVISEALIDGRLYLQPFASNQTFSMKTSDLRDSLYASHDSGKDTTVVVPVEVEFEKPCTAVGLETFNRDQTILYAPICEYALFSWDPKTNTSRRVSPQNEEILQVIEDIKPDDADKKRVWILTSREQKYYLNKVNPNEKNQRIIYVDLS